MIVVVGGEKGGTGKSTIATNLAAMRAGQGRDVLLIDTDAQGSASNWARVRGEDDVMPDLKLATIALRGEGIEKEIVKLSTKYQDIIIDAGGRDTPELRASMLKSNLLIVPSRPSSVDVHALHHVNTLVRMARGFNTELAAKLVINCAPTHATSTDAEEMVNVVANLNALELATSVVRDRVAFRRAFGEGKSVAEYSVDQKAATEMRDLYEEIFGGVQ
jgi:chromosome partitioning protein